MKDFLGRKILVGDFVARPGGGNTKGEYGLVLYKVCGFLPGSDGGKVSVKRLVSVCNDSTIRVYVRNSVVGNGNALVKVIPPEEVVSLFELAETESLSTEQKVFVLEWLCGSEHKHPWG